MISGLTKGEYWGIQAFMVKNSSLADITISLMTLPYLYMRPGHFCQMFMTNGDTTLSGKPIRLQAELNNEDHKKLFFPQILDHDRATFDFSLHPKRLEEIDCDFVILFAGEHGLGYSFDFVLSFSNLKKAWQDSEKGARMQVFDICFEKDLQQYRGWNVNSIEQSKDDIVFKSHIKFLTAVGVIKNRYSLSIEDYFSKTKHDPVFEYIRRRYTSHLETQLFCQQEGISFQKTMDFGAFYESEINTLRLSP